MGNVGYYIPYSILHIRSSRIQRAAFLLALLVPGAFFAWRIGTILPLFVDAHTRETVRSALVTVSAREGWLLSGITVEDVQPDAMRLTYRDRHRGADEATCRIVTLADSSLHPCD